MIFFKWIEIFGTSMVCMARKSAAADAGVDLSKWYDLSEPKLRRRIITSFKCKGIIPVTIDLDDIVQNFESFWGWLLRAARHGFAED